jgi:hypothetical protein
MSEGYELDPTQYQSLLKIIKEIEERDMVYWTVLD